MSSNTALDTIAILYPGDMGHAVGRVLGDHGHEVITCLKGRTERSHKLAVAGNIRVVESLQALVREASLILSILPPAAAIKLARSVADAMKETSSFPVYVDCNAISPDTAAQVGEIITSAGAVFIDGGIIGLAPGKSSATRFYVSGADTRPMESLDGKGFVVRAIGDKVGQASGLKMCYAGLTKGTFTLHTAVLIAAERMGLSAELRDEFIESQSDTYSKMQVRVPKIPADSGRWIGEMEEIARTFASVGVPSGFHEGAAEILRVLSRTPYAEETRENLDMSRTLEEAIPVYAAHLDKDGKT